MHGHGARPWGLLLPESIPRDGLRDLRRELEASIRELIAESKSDFREALRPIKLQWVEIKRSWPNEVRPPLPGVLSQLGVKWEEIKTQVDHVCWPDGSRCSRYQFSFGNRREAEMQTISSPQFLLEPLTTRHAHEMFSVLSDPAIYEFINKYNEDSMRAASQYLTDHPEYRADLIDN